MHVKVDPVPAAKGQAGGGRRRARVRALRRSIVICSCVLQTADCPVQHDCLSLNSKTCLDCANEAHTRQQRHAFSTGKYNENANAIYSAPPHAPDSRPSCPPSITITITTTPSSTLQQHRRGHARLNFFATWRSVTHHLATTFLAAVASVAKEHAGSEYRLTSDTLGPSTNVHNTFTMHK